MTCVARVPAAVLAAVPSVRFGTVCWRSCRRVCVSIQLYDCDSSACTGVLLLLAPVELQRVTAHATPTERLSCAPLSGAKPVPQEWGKRKLINILPGSCIKMRCGAGGWCSRRGMAGLAGARDLASVAAQCMPRHALAPLCYARTRPACRTNRCSLRTGFYAPLCSLVFCCKRFPPESV